MDQDAIIQYVTETFAGLDILRPTDGPGAGDTFFYHDPDRTIGPEHQLPFATIVTKDYGEYDNQSRLDRPGVYRLNIGVGRNAFRAVVGYAPGEEPPAGTVYDYAALDRLLPHPLYAAQSYVCVLNPSAATFESVKPLLAGAYRLVVSRHARGEGR
ncbi:MAG TPA: DUF6194 family protein [Ktedonobacterales bacterium]|nr:DUF6194 family protein [Ktedonobacterales bacterium]